MVVVRKETNDKSEDEDGFGIGGGYSSDRGCSRHSGAWQRGKLRDKKMPVGEKGENSDSSDDKDERSADLHSPNWKSLPLFSVPAAGSSGSPAGNTRSGAMARRAAS